MHDLKENAEIKPNYFFVIFFFISSKLSGPSQPVLAGNEIVGTILAETMLISLTFWRLSPNKNNLPGDSLFTSETTERTQVKVQRELTFVAMAHESQMRK